jgi:uncharacterized spore protein YtfJ
MPQGIDVFAENISNQEKANEVIGRLFEIAQPEQAFGSSVTQGEYTVITATELSVSMGLGYGGGGGGGGDGKSDEEGKQADLGFGIGGGGGGFATARPIAAIEIGPRGVVVEPIIDVTKIVLAFFTAVGSIAVMASRMNRKSQLD